MALARRHTEAALAHATAFVVSALGVPPADVIEAVHARGGLVGALIGSAEHARRQVAAGVDVVVAQGHEAGGHVGRISTLVLVPEVVDAVPGTAVLAAGGIGDGRQIAAIEALGAQGAWLGSLWLTTRESVTPDAIKQRLLSATAEDTTVSRAYSGRTVRLLATDWLRAWDEPGAPQPLKAPLQGALVHETFTSIAEHGMPELVTTPVGQIVGVLGRDDTVGDAIGRLQAEYRTATARHK
jgi:NAD(P)H-dependent flavin oxidoreductase YrpB (nitropropane dioxygenase family)